MFSFKDVKSLHIEPSSFCNAACPNCPRNHHGGQTVPWLKPTNLSLDDFQKFLPEALVQNLKQVTFCGSYGDPSLCPDLIEICKWLTKLNPLLTIQINTNGGTRNADFWSNLAKTLNPYSNVVFSIDGLQDTNHIYRRNVSWEKVMTAVTSFIGAGGNAYWDYLVFAHNAHQISEAKAMSTELGFRDIYIKEAMGFTKQGQDIVMPVLKKDNTFDYAIFPPESEAFRSKEVKGTDIEMFIPPALTGENYENQKTSPEHLYLDENHRQRINNCRINCLSKKNFELYISADGDLFPCCFIGAQMSKANKDYYLAKQTQLFMWQDGKKSISLHETSFQEILESDLFQKSLQKSWDTDDVRKGKLLVCGEMCGEDFGNYRPQKEAPR